MRNSVFARVLMCLLLLPTSVLAASFTPLDFRPTAVSGDGQIVLGADGERWSVSSGHLGRVDGPMSRFEAINYDGSRIGGSGPGEEGWEAERALVWDSSAGYLLNGTGEQRSYVVDLSDSGEFAVGMSFSTEDPRGTCWRLGSAVCSSPRYVIEDGYQVDNSYYPVGVSDQGVVVGNAETGTDRLAVRWLGRETVVLPRLSPGGFPSVATAISSDGSAIVGSDDRRPVRWDQNLEIQPLAPEGVVGSAIGVSADGSTIAGHAGGSTFIWTQARGMQDLGLLLAGVGIDVSGWSLTTVVGISAEGHTIVGFGTNPSGELQGFIAVIPEPRTALLMGLGLAGLAARRRG